MQQPRRRILLPLLLGVCLGWPAAWLVGKVLEPKPVFEVPIAPGYSAFIYQGSLHVSSMIDWNTYLYDLSNGTRLTLLDGKFNTVEDTPEPAITRPVQKIALTDAESPYYFNFSHERKLKERNRYIYFDPITGLSHRFHGYLEDDKYDEVIGEMNRRSRYCLLRRHLPFDLLLSGGLTPHDSPASLLLSQAAKLKPLASPSLHMIVTIPEKQIVSSFLLEGYWSSAHVILSSTGRYVACLQNNEEYVGLLPKKGDQLHRFWDVNSECWLASKPEADIMTYDVSENFLKHDVLVANSNLNNQGPYGCFSLLNVATGQILDQLSGISISYFPDKQVIKCSDDSLWYLSRYAKEKNGICYELKRILNSSDVEIIAKHSWDTEAVGITLTQGFQSIIPNTEGHTPFTKFIKEKLGDNAAYRAIESWIVRPSTSIFDWNTGRTYPGWSGDHRWQMSYNGEYLLIVHQANTAEQLKQATLAQVYRFPLEFYSPWWSRGTGMMIASLVFILLWRWQTRKLPKPNA